LFYRSIAPSFPYSIVPLLPPQFYGFIDDENEGDDGEQTGEEKGERFSVSSDSDTHKTVAFAGGRGKKDERDDGEIPESEFPPRKVDGFFEEVEREEENKSQHNKKTDYLQKWLRHASKIFQTSNYVVITKTFACKNINRH
jgi:hypothetical protein